MNKELMDIIRKETEIALERIKDHHAPLNARTRLTPEPSNYEVAQTYLLLQILEMLDSIDSRLIAVENAIEEH